MPPTPVAGSTKLTPVVVENASGRAGFAASVVAKPSPGAVVMVMLFDVDVVCPVSETNGVPDVVVIDPLFHNHATTGCVSVDGMLAAHAGRDV
jgi:hypothetical protein